MGVFMMHPVFLLLGIIAAFSNVMLLKGTRAAMTALAIIVPVILITAGINMLANHRGETVLMYTEYSYITLEAAVYGAIMGGLIGLVLMWFTCFNKVMTSDKIIFLLGRILPANSLIFSMVMRFIPNYRRQIEKISDAQKCIGMDVTNGGLIARAKHGMRILDIMFSWALESSIDTADSMKSRGYGIEGRTSYSIYSWNRGDIGAMLYLAVTIGIVVWGASQGLCHAEYYPAIVIAKITDPRVAIVYIAYIMLGLMPVVCEGKEALKWKHTR